MVTGGSSGIGKAIVTLFAHEGARVACVASVDHSKAQSVAAEVGKVAGQVEAYAADLSQWKEAERLIGEINDAFGSIDILVTAAGVFYPTPIGQAEQLNTEKMIAINLVGTIATRSVTTTPVAAMVRVASRRSGRRSSLPVRVWDRE